MVLDSIVAEKPGMTARAGAAAAPRPNVVSIRNVSKLYATGVQALKPIDLDIHKGEILALLGPNGAGKTTLINIVCGIVTASTGTITVNGRDNLTDYRAARRLIGLVPQELTTDRFESVWATVTFSRGLFGFAPDDAHVERVLRDLSLWDKRKAQIQALSGGMKRRVLIAKALAHEPEILFLDEPTAGVDVEMRHGMWEYLRKLTADGLTVLLTTHYLEEAEQLAKHVAIINKGQIIVNDTIDKVLAMHTDDGAAKEGYRGSKLEEVFIDLIRESNN